MRRTPHDVAHADAARSTAAAKAPRVSGHARASRARAHDAEALPPPLVWTFDGPLERCLGDVEDSLRRAILLIGDVARVAVLVDVSLPALQARVRGGDRIQPAWGRFVERLCGYGLPSAPRIRHLRTQGPLATLVVAYRS